MLAAPVLPFDHRQEPTLEEFLRRLKPDGTEYVRKKHGGQDFQAEDMIARATYDGTARHVDFGPDLGNHQFVIYHDGKGEFYAHTKTRPVNGAVIRAGQRIAVIGDEGVPGAPHLHYESLARWNDWYSTYYNQALHDLWEEMNMALSDDDKTWIHNQIKGGVQALGAALLDGSNGPSDWIPDEWDDTRLRYNLKKILATSGGGVDPDVIVDAVKDALRQGTS